MRAWTWEWARRLSEDITLTAFWFTELSRLGGVSRNEGYVTALSWMVAAYYEYLKGRWGKARAEKQVKEAEVIWVRQAGKRESAEKGNLPQLLRSMGIIAGVGNSIAV